MATIPTVALNNGVNIDQLGFGVFQIPPEKTQQVVEDALGAGYRHIDTAAAYANEAGVGAAIRASGLRREEIFVTTKLRNGDQPHARQAFERSRKALGLDRIDLYLIHWPVPSQEMFVKVWKTLEKVYSDGLVRAIGVSNFLPGHLDALLAEADVVPAVNQIELHPTFQQPEVAEKSRFHGLAVEAYSPLGQGADLDSAPVRQLAERHQATPAQIVLAWHLGLGHIVIPKSAHAERMRENLAAAQLRLNPDELDAVTALESGVRIGADPATAAFSQF